MDKKLILKHFKDIGFTSYEVKCYLSLLHRDTLTVAEISRLAAIPRPNAYEALEKLMTKGLCVARPGATKQYSASDPSLLADKLLMELQQEAETEMDDLKEDFARRLKKKEKEIIERTQTITQNVRKLIPELRPQYEKSRQETSPMDYIEIIKDPNQIHRRFIELVKTVKEELLGFTKPPYSVPRERVKEQTDPQAELVKRGVQIRIIQEISTDEQERRWQYQLADSAAKAGVEERALERVPAKMFVLDSTTVIFSLEDPVTDRLSLTTQIVKHRALAELLKISFEALWSQAEDYHVLEV
jgi:sugar-specific transcriptional regulator TrmB